MESGEKANRRRKDTTSSRTVRNPAWHTLDPGEGPGPEFSSWRKPRRFESCRCRLLDSVAEWLRREPRNCFVFGSPVSSRAPQGPPASDLLLPCETGAWRSLRNRSLRRRSAALHCKQRTGPCRLPRPCPVRLTPPHLALACRCGRARAAPHPFHPVPSGPTTHPHSCRQGRILLLWAAGVGTGRAGRRERRRTPLPPAGGARRAACQPRRCAAVTRASHLGCVRRLQEWAATAASSPSARSARALPAAGLTGRPRLSDSIHAVADDRRWSQGAALGLLLPAAAAAARAGLPADCGEGGAAAQGGRPSPPCSATPVLLPPACACWSEVWRRCRCASLCMPLAHRRRPGASSHQEGWWGAGDVGGRPALRTVTGR